MKERLQKILSARGVASRRKAEEMIEQGLVTLNGAVAVLGDTADPDVDEILVEGRPLPSRQEYVYILLHKPRGYVTTLSDEKGRPNAAQLVADCGVRVYPVGRLDRNTTGVLLFTNDGDMAKKLTHPSTGARKIYHVELDKNLTHADMQRMLEGLSLEDGEIAVDDVQYVGNGEHKNIVGVVLHSGRNRIVRRIFEAMGYEVCKLDRVVFAGLTKKDLPRGRWRLLTDKEVSFLKML